MKKETKNVTCSKNFLSKAAAFVKDRKWQLLALAAVVYAVFAPLNVAYAADAKWNAVIDFLVPWIQRLGGVLFLIGGIEVGFGFAQDNPSAKMQGWKFIVSGGIVFAVGTSARIFL